MPIDFSKKHVVGISSRALFDLEQENEIFEKDGIEAFENFQANHLEDCLEKGVAFPFVKRLLTINKLFPEEKPVEVVLLSKNSCFTGLRVFNSIKEHGLDITRASFVSGGDAIKFIPAFNVSLFLSMDEKDVKDGINRGFPAGLFLDGHVNDDEENELRIAFDFDGVIAGESAEKIYQMEGPEKYRQHETELRKESLEPGPLGKFFKQLSYIQKLEENRLKTDKSYKKVLKTSIVTARNAPAHERVITTLKAWGVSVDEMLLLGGAEKAEFLAAMKPHIYFDDQARNLEHLKALRLPAVHIPFGVTNAGGTNVKTPEGVNLMKDPIPEEQTRESSFLHFLKTSLSKQKEQ